MFLLRFIEKSNISKEQLENEFKIAEEVAPNYWISPQYTFYLSGVRVTIIKNKEIVWCYEVNGLCLQPVNKTALIETTIIRCFQGVIAL